MEKTNKDVPSITFTGGITVNGPMFDIHDNQNVYIGRLGNENPNEDENTNENSDYDEDLVSKLMPIFYNNEEDVWQFLKEIQGMAQEDITDVVNRWVEEKRISDYGNSRKGVLWGILHEAKLYTRSKTNWNERVK